MMTYHAMIVGVVRRLNEAGKVQIERRVRPVGSDFRYTLGGEVMFSPDFTTDAHAYWWLIGLRAGISATIDAP